MMSVFDMLLFVRPAWLTMEVMVWVISIPLAIAMMFLTFYQIRSNLQLKKKINSVEEENRYTVEQELVLRAMKVSVWRLDVPTQTLYIECDYREGLNNVVFEKPVPVAAIFNRMPEEYARIMRKSLMSLITGKEDNIHMEYQIYSDDKQPYWSNLFATVGKYDATGRPKSIIAAVMRNDNSKRVELELERARAKAEESDRLKSTFIANITHEVRTPLHAIMGFSDVLPLVKDDNERNEIINLLRQNINQALRLFDDMVNISKLEASDTSTTTIMDISLLFLLRQMADKYTAACIGKGITISLSFEDDFHIRTDEERLKEIINQYVNNAVKFTDKGEIRLGYTVLRDAIRIWVSDTGKGIPQEKCNNQLFDRFTKVDDFVAGMGLGLNICRNLAEAIGGKVGMTSTLGKGSTFWIDLAAK